MLRMALEAGLGDNDERESLEVDDRLGRAKRNNWAPTPRRQIDAAPTTLLAASLPPPCFGKVWSKQPLPGPSLPPAKITK